MPCLTLWPFPTCGLNGRCINEPNSTSFCLCNEGWSQSFEWNFFVDEEKISLASSPCHYNSNIIEGLYGLSIFLSIFDTVLQLLVSRNHMEKQLWKRKYWLAFNLVLFSVSVYRLADPEGSVFGVDFFFTSLITIGATLSVIHAYIILDKYLKYISTKTYSSIFNDERQGFYVRATRTRKIHMVLNTLSALFAQLMWITPWTESKTSLIIIRLGVCWSQVFRIGFETVFLYVSVSEVITDMERILNMEFDSVVVISDGSSAFRDAIRNQVPKLKSMRRSATIERCVEIILMSTVLADGGVLAWTYLVPIFCVSMYYNSLAGFMSKWNGLKSKSVSTSRSKAGVSQETSAVCQGKSTEILVSKTLDSDGDMETMPSPSSDGI